MKYINYKDIINVNKNVVKIKNDYLSVLMSTSRIA